MNFRRRVLTLVRGEVSSETKQSQYPRDVIRFASLRYRAAGARPTGDYAVAVQVQAAEPRATLEVADLRLGNMRSSSKLADESRGGNACEPARWSSSFSLRGE